MAFEKGHERVGGRKRGSSNKKTKQTKEFMMEVSTNPTLRKKYIKEMKSDDLKGKQFIDAYHASLDYSIGKMNKIDPNQKKLPPINITLIAASPQEVNKQNIIDITPHEEIDSNS